MNRPGNCLLSAMTLNEFLTYLTQGTIILTALVTLLDYLRHRDQTRLDIAFLFSALALNVILPRLISLFEIESLWLGKLNQSILMAHPFLLLRLVAHFRPISSRFYWFALAGLVVSLLLLISYREELDPISSVLLVVYFVVVELYAIGAFSQEARVTRGVTHYRLLLVAYGSALLAAVIAIAGLLIVLPTIAPVISPISQFLGVLSMISYYVGFAPPARLRRIWQLTELHRFLRQATGPWTGEPAATTLQRLTNTTVRATGGLVATVALWNEPAQRLELQAASDPTLPSKIQPGPVMHHAWQQRRPLLIRFPADFPHNASPISQLTGANAMLAVPIRTPERSWGILTVLNRRTPLFASDDLELMELLAEQTAIVLSYADLLNEQRLLVEQLQQRTKQMEEAYQELEAFSYSVSHDLRAPLRHVAGYVELLQKHLTGNMDEKSQRYLTVILQSATRMGTLIDDLLAFSRFGRTELKYDQVEMSQLVAEIIAELPPEVAGREIVWNIAPLPPAFADRSLISLVLVNLISNALKYTKLRSPAVIEIGYTSGQEEAVYYVRDNGVGFDMQYADKLFGVFQRLHTDPTYEGTGIGLANVRRIIQRHSGRVWAESTPEQGATFYFSLPYTVPNRHGVTANERTKTFTTG